MGGYPDRFVRLEFPDFSDGQMVFVTLKNPKLLPPSMLKPDADIPVGPDGLPTDAAAAEAASYAVMARLVKDWYVFDATSEDDDQPLLSLPANADSVAKLPLGIINKIAETMGAALNPR